MNLESLIGQIEFIDTQLHAEAIKAVNRMLTIRNWLIGYYIVEYEQNGEDRAAYGASLLNVLAKKTSIKGLTSPELSRCRQFYHTYQQFFGTVSQEFMDSNQKFIFGTASQKFISTIAVETFNQDTNYQELESPQIPVNTLLNKLSYSHFVELIKINEPKKRQFYETECIKGIWSVRELKRQINSLYYERIGISISPDMLSKKTLTKTTRQPTNYLIKNVYAFEFLGLPIKSAVEESDLESALLDHLREFILELGNGFCLEARQKRILIGDEYFFIDLVFYHRILKCHVLVELKVEEFSHANAGQLNTYLSYYKDEVKGAGDNDPIGILLVTHKNEALVKYATAGMDQNLFVSKYLLQLPTAKQLEEFIINELKTL
jgi:predicted nuclease of restriction endonuclease-like (RecB) superfamily